MTGLHKHQPAPGSVHFSHLIDMGAALAGACTDLARDPTPERCDRLIMKLRGAEQALGQFRRALVVDGELAHGAD